VLAHLETLELKNCGKVSWVELQQAWRAACIAHEAQAAAESSAANAGTNPNSSGGGGGSSRFSSSGGGFGSKLGAWLPTGRLFRTSSPSSNSIQSALAWQRTGTSSLFAKVHDLARGTSSAAAVAVAQLGIGAVGNGRSSCGGSIPEAPARSLLYRKQKEGAAAASASSSAASEESVVEADALRLAGSSGCFPVRNGLLRMMARTGSQPGPDEDSPRPVSMLSRVGSLVWHNSSAASAGTGSSSFVSGSAPSLAAQASCVQAALLAYIAQEDQATAVGGPGAEQLLPAAAASTAAGPADAAARVRREAAVQPDSSSTAASSSSSKPSAAANQGNLPTMSAGPGPSGSQHAAVDPAGAGAAGSCSHQDKCAGMSSAAGGAAAETATTFKRRRRTTGDRALPAMPFTKLASLSFTCSEATLRSPGPELAAVAALTSLTSLEISKCKLPDAVFVQLQSLSKVSKLKLTGLWSMGDAGLQHVAQLTTLKSLALSEAMHVTAQGLQVLSRLSGLTSLGLGFTQDLGPGTLAQLVNSLPQLQCLEVAAPSWSDVDCEMLADTAAAATAAGAQPSTRAATSAGAAVGSEPSTAAAAAAASPGPQMLWDIAGGSFSRVSSRTNSSRQLLAPAIRGNSSWSLHASSFNSVRSHSFGSFSLPAMAQATTTRAPSPARPLLVLRLHGCRNLTSRGMAALRQLPELHTLVLESGSEVRAAEVVSQGLLPPKLASLTLRGLPFGNLFSGCVSIPCCSTRLTKLELSSLEGAHDGQLRRLLSFFPNISDLSLAGCAELGDTAVPHLVLLPKLQELSLNGCGIVGHSLEHLRQLPRLRVLGFRGCGQLADAGLVQLVQLPALEELDVSECGAVSEQALLHVAECAPRLVRLDVSGCKAVTRTLVSSCPHFLQLKHSL